MNTLSLGLFSYDAWRRFKETFSPNSQVDPTLLSSLTSIDRESLSKVCLIAESLCKSAGLDYENVTIKPCEEDAFSCSGLPYKTVVNIGVNVIKGISSRMDRESAYFLKAYEEMIRKWPDSPKEIEKYVQARSDRSLHTYLGLHERCQWMLNDDEIRFILAHELKGHAASCDNASLLASALTISLVTYIGLQILFPDHSVATLLLISWIFAKMANLSFSRVVESSADYLAIKEDKEAKRGARFYFKRHLIAENAKEALESRPDRSISLVKSINDAIEGIERLKHPSVSARYQLSLASNPDN